MMMSTAISSNPTSENSSQKTTSSLSRYESQKRRDWNTFGQYLKNHKPPLVLSRCSGAHILEFLRYLDQFGKTKVHNISCPFFGHSHPPSTCPCPLRQAWGSLDALVGRLRAAFEENGGRPDTNPFGARAVRLYLREVRDTQAKARGIAYEKKKRKKPPHKIQAAHDHVLESCGGDDDHAVKMNGGGLMMAAGSTSTTARSSIIFPLSRNPNKDGLVCTARKPCFAVGTRNVDYKRARHFEVDLSALRNILDIDKERMIARVEPLVTMGQITRVTQGEAIRNYYHEMHVIQDMLVPLYKVYPIWLCPHRLYKQPVKTMVYPEPGFELQRRWGDTEYAQMYTDVGVYYAPGPVLRGEQFDGAEAVRQMENWLIENHGFQAQYSVSELTEKNFWRMFDAGLYEHCRCKYGDIGTFMSVYDKSKKGKKTEKEVQEAEHAIFEIPDAEAN
ncbi:hypothetical protein BUALT_Bualt18G0132700 [Buddleja alternifolia]|uniref:ALOG domain-containing protein n=1 Tax=Buddleja alternifolia TaxID=168488 RepID=A0AAV6W6D0_9LAMI|nr:hypothetical protein BUALT_Bualt18G0132700 [Buddleja alternifolia]